MPCSLRPLLTTLSAVILACAPVRLVSAAEEPAHRESAEEVNTRVEQVVRSCAWPGALQLPIGVTPGGTYIWCLIDPAALMPTPGLQRIVIAAAVDGDPATTTALQTHQHAITLGEEQPGAFARAWIPIANPDAWWACVHDHRPPQPISFPPTGSAYNTPGQVETAILSRFVYWFAPDAIVEITPTDDPDLQRTRETGTRVWQTDRFAGSRGGLDPQGRINVHQVRLPSNLLGTDPATWDPLTLSYTGIDRIGRKADTRPTPPPTVVAALARRERSPRQVAEQLLEHYGHKLNPVMYQPALPLISRLQYGELVGDPQQRELVAKVLEPYLAGERPSLDEKSNGSHFAGHLVFAAWADATGDPRAVALVRRVADRAFDAAGHPREAMPTHSEMSDAVFMACPILTAAGRLTGEARYIDMAERHFAFMQRLCLRDDGLYRHSPLCEAPWGRGNGFPALGLTLALSDLSSILARPHPGTAAADPLRDAAARVHARMLAAYQSHLRALLAHQDPTGCWRQVIDHPGAYRELTATAMISFAMARGLRHGWLDEATFRPAVARAWEALKLRVAPDGVLFDVCTGTGKQPTLQAYLDREAIFARDERGGAMALLFAMELARQEAARDERRSR